MNYNVARFRRLSKSSFPRSGGPLLRTGCIPRCCWLLVVRLRPNPHPQPLPQRHDLVLAGQGLQTVIGHAGAAIVQPGNGRPRAMLCVAGGGGRRVCQRRKLVGRALQGPLRETLQRHSGALWSATRQGPFPGQRRSLHQFPGKKAVGARGDHGTGNHGPACETEMDE